MVEKIGNETQSKCQNESKSVETATIGRRTARSQPPDDVVSWGSGDADGMRAKRAEREKPGHSFFFFSFCLAISHAWDELLREIFY